VTFSGSGLPAGLSLDTNSGLISGTVASGDANGSPYAVTVSATDGTHSSSASFSWSITHIVVNVGFHRERSHFVHHGRPPEHG
jgi:hypothetical protein